MNDTAKMPRISIITPCFNHVDFIEETIQSVLNQNYPNLEFIILDGGSTDGSQEIIQKYSRHLAFFRSEPDDGQYSAINEGFQRSTGDIMAWLNSDDKYHPHALETVAEIFNTFEDVNWITGSRTLYDTKGRTVKVRDSFRWSPYLFFSRQFKWIQQESTFWRRQLWDQAGAYLNTEYNLASDFELWIRFFRHARIYSVTTLIGGFRSNPGQRSEVSNREYKEEVARIIKNENFSFTQRFRILTIWIFKKTLMRLPIIGSLGCMHKLYEALYDFTPFIEFDRKTRVFKKRNKKKELF